MSKQKSKKPTNKDRDEAINSIISNIHWLRNQFELIGRLFDAYIAFKGDQDAFMAHIEKIKEEYNDKVEKDMGGVEDAIKENANANEAASGSDSKDS